MTCTQSSPTTIRPTRAAWLVAIAAVIALGGVSSTAQGQGQGRGRVLFADSAVPEDAPGASSADPTKRRGRRVRADVAALHDTSGPSAGDITLNLFDDVQLRARRLRLEPTLRGGSVWHGRLLDVAGDATIAVNDGVMAGTVFAEDRVYEILYAGDGEHAVHEIEPSAFPSDDFDGPLPQVEPDPQAGELDPLVEAKVAPDSASQVDVMVVWTPAATAAAGGMAAMQSLVDLSVANTNQAYANSGVTQRIRLVHAVEISYTESSPSTDLTRLTGTSDGYLDSVHGLRNTYGADVVTLIGATYANAGYCGLGYLMNYVSTGFAANAFNVVDRTCAAGNLSYAHEVGHNMGLHHDPANAGSSAAYSYAFGYQDPGGAFRTVMSYGGAPRVRHFSNPNVTYNGRVTGTSTQNNARALNNTASTVANFRQATVGGGSCSYLLGSSSASVGSGSATGSVPVVTSSGCAWSAASNAAWISVTGGASGSGPGTVGYSVAANTAGTSRTGALTIAGRTFTVTQSGAACSFGLSPTSTSVGAGGGSLTVSVTGTSGCARTATSNVAWVTVTAGASGTGSGTVGLGVAANTAGTSRTGTVTIAGQTFTLTQAKGLSGRKAAKPDFDGDSRGDLLWRRSDGAVAYWRMNDFESLATVFLGPGVGPEWKLAGAADLDGDDRPELIWRHQLGYVYAWFLEGDALAYGTFLTPGHVDNSWRLAAVADLNRDGKSDLIWQQDTGAIYVWQMNGPTLMSVTAMTPGRAGGDWRIMGAGDLNGDGQPDLIWQSPSTGALAAWLLEGTVATVVAWLTPSHVGPDWALRAVVDLTGDGISDLVWQHQTGLVAAWQMNGVALASFQYLSPSYVVDDWTLSGPH